MRLFEYDYLIVGQGLAGSILSYLLIKAGKKVLVIDQFNPHSSSQVAAGLVNPVTGRRVVKTWLADTLLPFAHDFYKMLEQEFHKDFYHPLDVLEVIHNTKDLNEWNSRMDENEMKKYFTDEAPVKLYEGKITEFKKMIRISASAWMNIPLFIETYRETLKNSSSLLEETFEFSNLTINDDSIQYGLIKSDKIIFCEGFKTLQNPLWDWVPLVPAKGEILTIECNDLPQDYILLSGIFLIPIGENKFRLGSTYEWNFPHELPTEEGKLKLLNQLQRFLKVPFEIIDHRAGVRPTVKDRRPLIGSHPEHKNVLLFNGMGTKGVQLIPYFAEHLVKHLLNGQTLDKEVDVKRFVN